MITKIMDTAEKIEALIPEDKKDEFLSLYLQFPKAHDHMHCFSIPEL